MYRIIFLGILYIGFGCEGKRLYWFRGDEVFLHQRHVLAGAGLMSNMRNRSLANIRRHIQYADDLDR